jgi:hypothetical protein
MLDDIQLRGIGWEVVDMHLLVIEVSEEALPLLMATKAVPNDQPWACEMTPQLLHTGTEVVPGEMLRDTGHHHCLASTLFLRQGERTVGSGSQVMILLCCGWWEG